MILRIFSEKKCVKVKNSHMKKMMSSFIFYFKMGKKKTTKRSQQAAPAAVAPAAVAPAAAPVVAPPAPVIVPPAPVVVPPAPADVASASSSSSTSAPSSSNSSSRSTPSSGEKRSREPIGDENQRVTRPRLNPLEAAWVLLRRQFLEVKEGPELDPVPYWIISIDKPHWDPDLEKIVVTSTWSTGQNRTTSDLTPLENFCVWEEDLAENKRIIAWMDKRLTDSKVSVEFSFFSIFLMFLKYVDMYRFTSGSRSDGDPSSNVELGTALVPFQGVHGCIPFSYMNLMGSDSTPYFDFISLQQFNQELRKKGFPQLKKCRIPEVTPKKR